MIFAGICNVHSPVLDEPPQHIAKSMSRVGMRRPSGWLRHADLVMALTRREVIGRYRGSVMGVLWSFLHPLLMLAVYTFVFSVVFRSRWPGGTGDRTEFALMLFTGLVVFNIFSECLNKAPNLVLGNVNYVKKVVFPLEVLPVVSLLSALFHAAVSLAVWCAFHLLYFGWPPVTGLLFPIVLLPLVLLTLGASWFLASLGVYLRDVAQMIGIVTTVLLFLSPVFYSVDVLPERFHAAMRLNPLTDTIEQARTVLVAGGGIDMQRWLTSLAIGLVVAVLGYAWFRATRKGFADVL